MMGLDLIIADPVSETGARGGAAMKRLRRASVGTAAFFDQTEAR